MLNHTFACSWSKNLSSFRFIIKQQWTIEEISIFSNSSYLEWRTGLSETILKGTHPRTIPARFGLIWYRGFRGEDLNVNVYDVRRTDDRRQVMTRAHRWAKNISSKLVEKIFFSKIYWNLPDINRLQLQFPPPLPLLWGHSHQRPPFLLCQISDELR